MARRTHGKKPAKKPATKKKPAAGCPEHGEAWAADGRCPVSGCACHEDQTGE